MFDFFIHVASIACLYGVLALSLLSVVAGYAGMLRATQLTAARRLLR